MERSVKIGIVLRGLLPDAAFFRTGSGRKGEGNE